MAIIAFNKQTLETMFSYLKEIFFEYVDLKKYTVREYLALEEDGSDLVLLSGYRTFEHCRARLINKEYIVGNRYIDYRNINELSNIKDDSVLYIVNDEEATAVESIRQLKEIGYKFKMIPYYPGAVVDPAINTAITIGEPGCVPESIDILYDVGSRVSSISTINRIALALELSHNIIDSITLRYMTNYVSLLERNKFYRTKMYHSNQLVKQVFNHSKEGICLLDRELNITTVNDTFLEMFSIENTQLIGSSLEGLLAEKGVSFSLENVLYEGEIIKMKDRGDVFLTGSEVSTIEGNPILIYSSYTLDVNEKEVKIRRNLRKSEERKHYDFSDYLTNDYKSQKMIERARMIAKTNSSVLIQGESGTGKEILAQAIHDHSDRWNENFMAINFAAIQPSLLESELFGYGKGSFTGAKKSGSIGLIEKAHKGTIFFDEIGDAPMSFQVRLLRVLQERVIRRIGETDFRPVDVRVIVATNKDLLKMVEEGTFREDLYYRINVMPLDTVALRNRKGDIPLLLNHYMPQCFKNKDMTLSKTCTEDVLGFLMNYEWKGNVREIVNIAEYFAAIKGAERIGMQDLPGYMMRHECNDSQVTISDIERRMLFEISKQPKIGRAKLCSLLKTDFTFITEGKVRTHLKELREKELIKVNATRGGTEISEEGYRILGNL